MLTVKENIKVVGYHKLFYDCPHCGTEFPLMNSIFYCVACRKSIVDIGLILDSPKYALRYHFGLVKEVGTYPAG